MAQPDNRLEKLGTALDDRELSRMTLVERYQSIGDTFVQSFIARRSVLIASLQSDSIANCATKKTETSNSL
jgi:hypothetical protein